MNQPVYRSTLIASVCVALVAILVMSHHSWVGTSTANGQQVRDLPQVAKSNVTSLPPVPDQAGHVTSSLPPVVDGPIEVNVPMTNPTVRSLPQAGQTAASPTTIAPGQTQTANDLQSGTRLLPPDLSAAESPDNEANNTASNAPSNAVTSERVISDRQSVFQSTPAVRSPQDTSAVNSNTQATSGTDQQTEPSTMAPSVQDESLDVQALEAEGLQVAKRFSPITNQDYNPLRSSASSVQVRGLNVPQIKTHGQAATVQNHHVAGSNLEATPDQLPVVGTPKQTTSLPTLPGSDATTPSQVIQNEHYQSTKTSRPLPSVTQPEIVPPVTESYAHSAPVIRSLPSSEIVDPSAPIESPAPVASLASSQSQEANLLPSPTLANSQTTLLPSLEQAPSETPEQSHVQGIPIDINALAELQDVGFNESTTELPATNSSPQRHPMAAQLAQRQQLSPPAINVPHRIVQEEIIRDLPTLDPERQSPFHRVPPQTPGLEQEVPLLDPNQYDNVLNDTSPNTQVGPLPSVTDPNTNALPPLPTLSNGPQRVLPPSHFVPGHLPSTPAPIQFTPQQDYVPPAAPQVTYNRFGDPDLVQPPIAANQLNPAQKPEPQTIVRDQFWDQFPTLPPNDKKGRTAGYDSLEAVLKNGFWFGEIDFLYFEPIFQENNAFAISGGAGTTVATDYGFNVSPRVSVGFETNAGPAVKFTFWRFNEFSNLNEFTFDAVQSAVTTIDLGDSDNQFQLGAGASAGSQLSVQQQIKMNSSELLFFKDQQNPISTVRGNVGLRHVSLQQFLFAGLNDPVAGSQVVRNVNDYFAGGPKLGIEYFRPIGHTNLELQSGLFGSLLFGRRDQSFTELGGTNVQFSQLGKIEPLTIFELYLGVQWNLELSKCQHLFFRTSIESQLWAGSDSVVDIGSDLGFYGVSFSFGLTR